MLTVSNGTSRLKRSGQEGVGLSQGLVEDSQAVAASASLTLSGGAINSSLASTTRIARTRPIVRALWGRSGSEERRSAQIHLAAESWELGQRLIRDRR
jgi:hypothetical protein